MTQYKIPKKWVKYLITQPETAMGCQIVDIYFKGKTLENVVILNGETFEVDCKKLNLSKIEKIVVKEREELKEKNFQTINVKITPTKEGKMANYYLIEEYMEYDDRPGGSSWKAYSVQSFGTKDRLLEAVLKGSKHGGKLIPTKGLELKLELEEEKCNGKYPELPIEELERQLQKHYKGRL